MTYLEGLEESVVEEVQPRPLRTLIVWTVGILVLAIAAAVVFLVPLMPLDRDELTVSFSHGEAVIVSADGSTKELVPGTGVRKGDMIKAEEGASVTLAVADGHHMTITDASEIEVKGSKATLLPNQIDTRIDVKRGNVRISGEGGPRTSMEIGLPNGVAGVRGTIFDVKVGDRQSAISVHEGSVALDEAPGDPLALEPGQGVVVGPEGSNVRDLPAAPESWLETEDVIRETGKRIKWHAVDDAAAYTVEIASDEEFLDILAHIQSTETEAAIPVLDADPPLYLRVYAVDGDGLTSSASDPEMVRTSRHWYEGLKLREQGDLAGSIAEFEAAKERYPGEPKLMRDIGWSLHLDQKWEDARTVYEEARRLAPDDTTITFELGRVYHLLGDYERAETMYQSILDDHPEDAHALWGLGDTYRMLGRRGEAKRLVRQALVLQPDHPYAKDTLAQLQ